jgi:hypothetical protein
VLWGTAWWLPVVVCCTTVPTGKEAKSMSYFGWGLVLLGAYVVLVILARWIYIARPNIVWTSVQAGAMAKRLSFQVEQRPSSNGKGSLSPATLQRLVEELKQDIHKETPEKGHTGVLAWNGSHQIAQWVLMHEAERLALPSLSHAQLVARLERALGQLSELPQPRREAWEDVIRDLLDSKEDADTGRLNRAYRAYLDELLGEIYEASNGNAIQLAGLYNRATWVILVALLPLAVLAGLGYGVLLVAGAIGGLVSRMQRLVFSTRIPISYGSSWAPLFCAPILGALAAWAGLVLISLLQTAGVLQLTTLQTSLADLKAPSAAVLGTAILLGVSERFLLRLEKQAEAVIDPDRAGPSDQAAPANTSAATQRMRLLHPPASAPVGATTATTTAGSNGHAPTASTPTGQPEPQPSPDTA